METIHSYLDSAICEKGRHGKLYTLTIRDYGVFVVTKDVYDKVKVGDEVLL
ncbi:TPA: DUF1372 family protein [Streptococcus pneumoniae]|nr:DUF1372 family protein [Streptococcus pneumoniae]